MNQDTLSTLIQTATQVRKHAHAPYSHFPVGAAVLDEHGTIHHGCNVENAAYPSGSCAEEQAIGSMVASGGKKIKAIVVTGISGAPITPCGACRQRIREFADSNTQIYICHVEEGVQKVLSIDELLPYSFGSDNLEGI